MADVIQSDNAPAGDVLAAGAAPANADEVVPVPADQLVIEEASRGASPERISTAHEPRTRPSFIFFGVVAAVCLLADVTSKAWAEVVLHRRSHLDPIVLIPDHLNFALAYNRGGAWGLLQNASESLRRPFFLVVSLAAIAFIVSLYGKLQPTQRALRWGLPLVLGGALGNLADRVTRGSVVDFIDYRADWVHGMNQLIARVVGGWNVTDHWPTFNVADISICVGVGLMAVDMLMSGRRQTEGTRVVRSSSSPPGIAG
jgi:signal peptidase II